MSKTILSASFVVVLVSATLCAASHAAAAGDPAAGKIAYGACMSCHSIEDNDIGPAHRGVVGRKAGSIPGYSYSIALKNSGIVWTPEMIDRWLQGPQKLVPGTKMFFSVGDAKTRADIIAYLATQK
ncbi:c-type cytochrome [Paraburkholderia sp. SARCC-3016]|uniref:c-type cytochrome n=1 Tax=Paraburkholderia sp. SARCC-3016 TaxID=3058611 RepID=UPI002808C731|nr:c-type cytochrome [Paraburkholderia sp. SARCC-3016]MDQ7980657.1 c-type cytochrome [Paraburkholderia sp. SARCC-3016]